MTIPGGCLCGGVSFEITQAVGPFEICHCSRCRKVSGAGGLPMLRVRTAEYRLLTGADLIESFAAPILRTPPAYHTHFCRVCGSPVPPAQPAGEFLEIAAGLFDADPGLRPDKHIYVESGAPWHDIDDGLPRYNREELARLRRQAQDRSPG